MQIIESSAYSLLIEDYHYNIVDEYVVSKKKTLWSVAMWRHARADDESVEMFRCNVHEYCNFCRNYYQILYWRRFETDVDYDKKPLIRNTIFKIPFVKHSNAKISNRNA